MKVLCLPEPGNLVIKDLPMPELKEGQAIVKMEMCGICGSDVTAYRGVNPTMRYPINGLGHELSLIHILWPSPRRVFMAARLAWYPSQITWSYLASNRLSPV